MIKFVTVLCPVSLYRRSRISGDAMGDKVKDGTQHEDQKCACCQKCPVNDRMKACLTKVRQMISNMVNDIFFDLFINFCIVLNTIVMSLEHHGMDKLLIDIISMGSIVGDIVANFFLFLTKICILFCLLA